MAGDLPSISHSHIKAASKLTSKNHKCNLKNFTLEINYSDNQYSPSDVLKAITVQL